MTCCLLGLLPQPVAAQEPLEDNDFNIDAFTGPVLGSSRVVGMAGAHTALATDIDGAHWNPASFGSRPPEDLSLGFHLGAETEIVDNRLKLRAGFYLEPARNSNSVLRPHGTAGLEVRMFAWDFFGCFRPFDLKVSLTVDGAERYLDIGIGIGVWH